MKKNQIQLIYNCFLPTSFNLIKAKKLLLLLQLLKYHVKDM